MGSHAGNSHQYVLTDHLGTPRAIVHPGTNAIVWRWDLTGSAFGDHAAQNDPDGDTVAYTFNLRYPGQYYDAETGLHYNYFRDYDPSTGRYVQSDPIGLIGGDSTFSYAANNPTFLTDKYGLISKEQLNTFLGRADRGREMTTCTTQLWRGIISGDQSALAVALDHCSFDFPLADREKLEKICDLYREGRSLKKMDEREVARRLGLDVRSFHNEFKEGIVRSNRQSLKDHGMGNNPGVILGKDNRVFLRDVKTGMTIPITP